MGALAILGLLMVGLRCFRKDEQADDDDDNDDDDAEDEYEEEEIIFDLEMNDSSHSSTWSDSIFTVDSFANDEHNAVYRPAFGVHGFGWSGQNNGLTMRDEEIIG